MAIVSAEHLTRRYGEGEVAVDALVDVSVAFESARFAAIMGPGIGKSTLMHILAGLDRPTSGTVTLDGVDLDVARRPRADAAPARARRLHLPDLQPAADPRRAREHPAAAVDRRNDVDAAWFDELVDAVGIGDRLHHRPAQLSGGQQQRVAIARALVSRPAVVFADEPTGNLDSAASGEVLELLRLAVDRLRADRS